MRFDANRNCVHCFACGVDYDFFDLVSIDYGLSTWRDIWHKADELAGGEAVALGRTANWRKLVQWVGDQPPAPPLLLVLDNDDAGRVATEKLVTALADASVQHRIVALYGRGKDANEALCTGRDDFIRAVREASARGTAEEQASREAYCASRLTGHLRAFWNGVEADAANPCFPTGFVGLDETLEGGLYEGLYLLGVSPVWARPAWPFSWPTRWPRQAVTCCFFAGDGPH